MITAFISIHLVKNLPGGVLPFFVHCVKKRKKGTDLFKLYRENNTASLKKETDAVILFTHLLSRSLDPQNQNLKKWGFSVRAMLRRK